MRYERVRVLILVLICVLIGFIVGYELAMLAMGG